MSAISAEFTYARFFEAPPTGELFAVREEGNDQLVVMVGGWYETTFDGRTITAEAGDVVFIRRGTQRHERTDPRPRRVMRAFNIHLRWQPPVGVPPTVHDDHGRVRELAKALLEVDHSPSPHREAIRRGFLHGMLAEYLLLGAERLGEEARLVRDYTLAHLAEPFTVKDLAAHLSLSETHFIRRYKQVTGRTPMDEVRRLRVERARELLRDTDLPLKQIAPMVGLASGHHLSRLMRRYLNIGARDIRA